MDKEKITFVDNDGEEVNLDDDLQEIAVSIARTTQLVKYEDKVNYFASCKFTKSPKVDKQFYYTHGFDICREQIKKQINGGKKK